MIINTASASFLSHYLILNIAQQSGFLPQNVIWNFLMLKFILSELTLQAERHRDVWAPCILFGIVNDGDYLLHNCTILYQIFIDQPELLVLDIQRLWTYWHVPLIDFLSQFPRCFVLRICRLWTTLPSDVVNAPTIDEFKILTS